MKKIAVSVGLLALGASALHAVESSTLNPLQKTKAWSVAATLRGFYDDNVSTSPDNGPNGIETTGFEFRPSVDFGLAGEQTSFNLGYAFTARYYDKNPTVRADKDDYTHTFDADLSHAFSPRFDVALSESFVIGQEPDLLRDPASTQRIDGDNIRNFAGIDFNLAVTELLGLSFGYKNSLYDYDDEGATTDIFGNVIGPSNSGLLDRMEHNVRFDTNWRLTPQTVGVVGYMYSQTGYNGDEAIAGNPAIPAGAPNGVVMSEFRDSRGHTFYVGAQHVFSPTLSGALNIGAQYYSYFNDPADEAQWSPYVQGSLTYAMQAHTSLDLGVRYSRSAANVAGFGGTSFVRDTETAVVFAALQHEIASKLTGTVNVNAQHSEYNGGGVGFDGEAYLFYQLGFDLAYQFTQNLSGHVGYNFDKLDSDLQNRSYERNRVYVGVTAGF